MSFEMSVLVEGLDHPEGIAVHPDGSIWCGGEAGQIYRIDPASGQVEEVASTGGFVLGLAFSPDLDWLAVCDAKRKALLRLDLDSGHLEVFADRVGDWQLNIPNYPVFDGAGRLYLSESGDFGKSLGRIFRFTQQGRGEFWAGGNLVFANGLALDFEERYLYVVESFLPGICRYPIRSDGTAGERELFVSSLPEVPDGLAFDSAGRLYCSCYSPSRIYQIEPSGSVSVLVEDPTAHMLSNCTNIAFGGTDFDTLFASNLGRWHVTRIDLRRRGAPLVCHQRANRPSR